MSNIETPNTFDNSHNESNMGRISESFTSGNDAMKLGADEFTAVTMFSASSSSLPSSNSGENIYSSETKSNFQINRNKEPFMLYFSDSDSEDNIASPICHIHILKGLQTVTKKRVHQRHMM